MKLSTALKVTLVFGLGGVIFSGYLSYYNIWGSGCEHAFISCGGAKAVKIFGQPTCVYGFFMFLITAILSLIGLAKSSKLGWLKSVFVVALIGTLFSLSLSIYELWIIDTTVNGLPACVYGFFFYAVALIASIFGLTAKTNLPAVQNTPPSSTPI
ncbi:MAG: vitamin K epoxide reductase family protein [Patescibacteria group bacterium]|jgi:uncharacterized membrane protein